MKEYKFRYEENGVIRYKIVRLPDNAARYLECDDADGNELYEGDIITRNGEKYTVGLVACVDGEDGSSEYLLEPYKFVKQ